jgi:hypothetical protein
MTGIGRYLIVAGLAMAAVGVLLVVGERFGLGRLPGDLEWKRKGVSVHFPIMTSLVISVVLTVLLNLFLRRK